MTEERCLLKKVKILTLHDIKKEVNDQKQFVEDLHQ